LPDGRASRVVLVGVGRYQVLSQLEAVHNNLFALSEALRDPRVWGLPPANCVVVRDPDSPSKILDAITEAALEATDTLLVYYAGHGLIEPRRGEFHIALVGSNPLKIYTAVPYAQIRDALLDSRAERKIVILDCCYSGRALGLMGDAAETVVTEASAEGTYVLAAAAENRTAVAPDGARFTAFTGELLRIIEQGIGGQGPLLDLDSIYRELRAAMRAKGFPLPQKRERNTAGQLDLVRNRAFSAEPAPRPSATGGASPGQRSTSRQARADPPDTSVQARPSARGNAEVGVDTGPQARPAPQTPPVTPGVPTSRGLRGDQDERRGIVPPPYSAAQPNWPSDMDVAPADRAYDAAKTGLWAVAAIVTVVVVIVGLIVLH
jgi:peptide/nickel transport system substrate-binding protein